MKRHELLEHLHRRLKPRTYFEIGVNEGLSLTLSRSRTVAVDPFYSVTREICCDLHLVRAGSDEFFARQEPFAHFDEPVIDLAFIDGMHLAEYALRDLINTERYTHAGSVIVVDDMLPRSVAEARRDRDEPARQAWTGDVYKLIGVLRDRRPDLVCIEVDTHPTGTVVLLLPDPSSRALLDAYDSIVDSLVVPDPQAVPDEIVRRTRAVEPKRLLSSRIWGRLRQARQQPDESARPLVRAALREAGLLAGVESVIRG